MSVRSVSRAVAIMRHLAQSGPQGVNGLARAVDVAPSTCFNIVKTLLEERLVVFDEGTKAYSLDRAAVPVFSSGREMADWFAWLRDRMIQIAHEQFLTCGLWEVRDDRVILNEVADSPNATRVHLSLGQRLPSHIGAMGRCIAAAQGLSRAEVERVVTELRWQSPPSIPEFCKGMEHARNTGWAVDMGNYIRGLTTVASLIQDKAGCPRWCITGIGFAGQHDADGIAAIGASIADVASVAEARLKELHFT